MGTLARPLAGALLCLAGCGTLPTFAPDPSHHPGPPLTLSDVHGPLSPGRGQGILDRLARDGLPTDIFERHLALEQSINGSPLTVGNDVQLLEDGQDTYRSMYAAIASARDHIHLETYIFDDDDVGRGFAQLLVDKRRQGVQVNVIRDSVGTVGTPAAFFERMTAAGVRVLEFNPIKPWSGPNAWELNRRDHRKLLIVDGHTAYLGGTNISSVHSGSARRAAPRTVPAARLAWRDADLRLRGPVVAELQRLFLATWASQGGEPLTGAHHFPDVAPTGTEVVRAIGSSPDEPYSLIYVTLLSAIGSALTSVRLTSAYFAPDPQLLAALEAAAARGVEVELILPGRIDSWLVFHAGRSHYDRLLRAGVKIHERRGVILHAKTALVDGVWATVGSANLDWRSFLHNHELNAVVLGTGFGSRLQAMIDRDLAASDAITLAQWERRPLGWRLKESFAQLWEHWL